MADATPKAVGPASARKVLEVLFSFSERRVSATVRELAEVVDVPVPTAYRHAALLKDMQLLAEGPPGSYHPTTKVLALARAAQLANGLADIAQPLVAEAAEAFGETVMLMQYTGDAVVCVAVEETQRAMRFTFHRGHTVELGRGASGKMTLAMLSAAIRERILADLQIPGLEHDLVEIDARGFATSLGEMDDGVWACSVPVASLGGSPVVVTVAGPDSRFDDRAREAVPDRLIDFADRLRAALGRHSL